MFQIDFAVFFDMQSAPHAFFAGIELQNVAWPFDSVLPLSTVSDRPPGSKFRTSRKIIR